MATGVSISNRSDIVVALGVVAVMAVLVLPMPPFLIDILLALSFGVSLLLLLRSVYVMRALEFSAFPSILLITTLFRLALNVATTRLILLHGAEQGEAASGSLIKVVGQLVVGGNYAVGVVIFTILVIINFIVITKGAGRVAEVAARFTLDAMPGKQMAIDADLNAGIINEETARLRRSEIAREADFYGAMDGSSKFVRGDAIAGILILLVNIVGGLFIGTIQKGMDFADAAQVFMLLTIGDGLVTQIPALVISTAAGILVTRTSTGTSLGEDVKRQLFGQPRTLLLTSGVLVIIGFVFGSAVIPFLLLAGLFFLAYRSITKKEEAEAAAKKKLEDETKLRATPEKLESLLPMDTLELEVGYGLISVVDADQGGDLLERVTNIRKQFAVDLGIIVPVLRIRDNLELKAGEYQILLKGAVIGTGTLMPGHLLAMDPGSASQTIPGIPTKEPAFGLDALWISPRQRDEAAVAGYTIVDLSTVVATHLTEIVRQYAHELLSRQELQTLLDSVKSTSPKLIEELIPNVLPVPTLMRILKNLLKEGVSIRDMKGILEAISEHATQIKDANMLTEYARTALARMITRKLVVGENEIPLITLDRNIEETIAAGLIQTDQGQQLSLDPEFVRAFVAQMNFKVGELASQSPNTVVLCSPLIRYHLKNLLDRFIPNTVVLSHNEITSNIRVRAVGTVRMSNAS